LPEGKTRENERTAGEVSEFVPPVGPRSPTSSRDLPLVRLAAWLVIAGFVLLVIWVAWRLATHDPSPMPIDSD